MFDEQITPMHLKTQFISADGELINEPHEFKTDEGPRADTSFEILNKLRPVFKVGGTVTAGNSSQMNDAASAVLIASGEVVKELGIEPMAHYVSYQVAGVAPVSGNWTS